MKVSRKLSILFVAAFIASIILQLSLRYYDVKQRTVLLDAQKTGFESIINNVLKLKKEKYGSATDDYSGWDEMVGYTRNHSEEFADANLNTVLTTFKADYVWVYDGNIDSLFYTKSEYNKRIFSINDFTPVKTLFEKKPIVDFFVRIDSSIIQVFGATIVPTSDYKTHIEKPSGYFLLAKVWDRPYIEEFEKATDSKIRIYGNTETVENENPDIETSVTRIFKDFKGEDFLKINFRKTNEYLVKFDEISIYSFIISTAVWLIGLLIFLALSRSWITNPLDRIEKALVTNDITHLESVKKFRNEFGDIADLMDKYFLVNRNLKEEIVNRRTTEENLATVLNATNDSIVMVDFSGRIISVNESFLKQLGLQEKSIAGRNLSAFISENNRGLMFDKLKESGSKNLPVFFESMTESTYRKNAVYPIKDESGNVNRFVIFSTDISDFKRNEQILKEAEERAREMSKLKSSFLGNMSHELRTPMVGILGFAEILRDKIDDDELKQMAEMINISGKRLMKTLNLILDLTRIEAGKIAVNITKVDIAAVTQEVYRNFERQASIKKLGMKFISPGKELYINTDGDLYWQIMNNLISNAVKYTEKGEVCVALETERRDSKDFAVIKVIDTGIGIPEESLMVIFEEFRQVSEGFARKFEGTGLGLTITKRFIEKLGGTISVHSIHGKGTTFTVKFPMETEKMFTKEVPVKSGSHETDDNSAVKANILCVDDDTITKDFIDVIFNKSHNVEFADNGPAALEMASAKKYSLVLMDINLGKGMNGMEVTRELRKIKGYEKVPVVAMTAFAMSGDDEEFYKAGLDAYISKPFDIKKIKNLVDEQLNKSGS